MSRRPRLLFVSPRFLLPADSGGKIRTGEILRHLKGGAFEVVLASPRGGAAHERHATGMQQFADRVVYWPEPPSGTMRQLRRIAHVLSRLPVPVASDRSRAGSALIERELRDGVDVVVFDFTHAAVLAPQKLHAASVLFTHNVEAEIFERHTGVASNPVARAFWGWQSRKMFSFEAAAARRFDTVIAVSERDVKAFTERYGATHVAAIPTGVDVERHQPSPREAAPRVVFIGSMDWLANVDAMQFFMDEVWPGIAREVPEAQMTVVGRAPPRDLVTAAERRGLKWKFTGYVDEVKPHVQGAAVSVIPLRVGGGTRIKAFEAMAMGVPVVSTSIGVEGLPIRTEEHFLGADAAADFARAVVRLLQSPPLGERIARQARTLVEERFSNRSVARVFERICLDTLARREATAAQSARQVVQIPRS